MIEAEGRKRQVHDVVGWTAIFKSPLGTPPSALTDSTPIDAHASAVTVPRLSVRRRQN